MIILRNGLVALINAMHTDVYIYFLPESHDYQIAWFSFNSLHTRVHDEMKKKMIDVLAEMTSVSSLTSASSQAESDVLRMVSSNDTEQKSSSQHTPSVHFLCSELDEKYKKDKMRMTLVTSSPAFIQGLQYSKNWVMTRKPSRLAPPTAKGVLRGTTSEARLTATFEFTENVN